MDLVRDVLDLPVLDPDGLPVGRVDGIVAELDADGRLRVRALEIGGATRARRLHPRLADWTERMLRRVRPVPAGPSRIPWSDVETVGRAIRLRSRRAVEGALGWERWLARHVIGRIPGS
jgi:sporulation protein YlmC with PRC-barrel domain